MGMNFGQRKRWRWLACTPQEANRIKGFSKTHQPSPWMNDYGHFRSCLSPVICTYGRGTPVIFNKAETVTPYHYIVYLADHNVTTEITPTERAARFRFTFLKPITHTLLLMPLTKDLM
jgi:putative alpha-1,2-mannosidase